MIRTDVRLSGHPYGSYRGAVDDVFCLCFFQAPYKFIKGLEGVSVGRKYTVIY
jgi:hypothetical protein